MFEGIIIGFIIGFIFGAIICTIDKSYPPSQVCKLMKENERLEKELNERRRSTVWALVEIRKECAQLKQENEKLKEWNKCLAEKRHDELKCCGAMK